MASETTFCSLAHVATMIGENRELLERNPITLHHILRP